MYTNMSLLKTIVVLCTVVLSTADDYENKLTKLWSLSGTAKTDGSAVLNVTSASIVIQPRKEAEELKYAFKPRAIPLRREPPQLERTVYYSSDYKPEVLFPGNYIPIAKEKSIEKTDSGSQGGRAFHPKAIPLLRAEEDLARSNVAASEPVIKKPEGFSEQTASRRSISYFFDDLEEGEEGEAEEGEEEIEAEDDQELKHRKKPIKKLKHTKLKKYVLPLLLAYKMKYFALVPIMIGGLILLIGATGLAGFFFALFAAVMGLQKGGGY